MNDLQVNQFSYNFNNGTVASAQVGLYGSNTTDGEYINSSIRVNQSDLPEGKSFMEVAMADMVEIARQKLAADTEVNATTTTAQAQPAQQTQQSQPTQQAQQPQQAQ